ncbi:hypothetical protein B0H13DRAFT_1860558 [Mycena leptocephala]|nr:hypothetical protein B0H13DRAFT_1860558 [Mycena leptocephala]
MAVNFPLCFSHDELKEWWSVRIKPNKCNVGAPTKDLDVFHHSLTPLFPGPRFCQVPGTVAHPSSQADINETIPDVGVRYGYDGDSWPTSQYHHRKTTTFDFGDWRPVIRKHPRDICHKRRCRGTTLPGGSTTPSAMTVSRRVTRDEPTEV